MTAATAASMCRELCAFSFTIRVPRESVRSVAWVTCRGEHRVPVVGDLRLDDRLVEARRGGTSPRHGLRELDHREPLGGESSHAPLPAVRVAHDFRARGSGASQ